MPTLLPANLICDQQRAQGIGVKDVKGRSIRIQPEFGQIFRNNRAAHPEVQKPAQESKPQRVDVHPEMVEAAVLGHEKILLENDTGFYHSGFARPDEVTGKKRAHQN
jgi:hypothetical protein